MCACVGVRVIGWVGECVCVWVWMGGCEWVGVSGWVGACVRVCGLCFISLFTYFQFVLQIVLYKGGYSCICRHRISSGKRRPTEGQRKQKRETNNKLKERIKNPNELVN